MDKMTSRSDDNSIEYDTGLNLRYSKRGSILALKRIREICHLMKLILDDKVGLLERSSYQVIYIELDLFFNEIGFENPNLFETLEEFYVFCSLSFRSNDEKHRYLDGLYKDAEAFISSLEKESDRDLTYVA